MLEGVPEPIPASRYLVRLEFRPYSYQLVRHLIKDIHEQFGSPGALEYCRWSFRSPYNYHDTEDCEANEYVLDFEFRDQADAVLFGLKYQR